MRIREALGMAALTALSIGAVSAQPEKAVTLTNGFTLTPAGASIPLVGDMPTKMLFTPDGSRLVVETTGYHDHSLCVISVASHKLLGTLSLQKLWPGIAFGPDGHTFYAAGGKVYSAENWKKNVGEPGVYPAWAASFKRSLVRLHWEPVGGASNVEDVFVGNWDTTDHFAAGAAVGADGSLYMLDQDHDQVVKIGGSPLSVLSRANVGYRPYSVIMSPDGKTLAVSNWGDSSVSLVDVATFSQTRRIAVGSHPNELVYGRDGRLFVACAGSNSVSVIRGDRVVETIDTALRPHAPVGSTPDAVAVSPDGKRLYVANADNNDVAVVDISGAASRVRGFIPTGWYPSAVAVSPDGKTVFVGTAKGMAPLGPNYPAHTAADRQQDTPAGLTKRDYIGNLLQGAVSAVAVPTDAELAAYTRQVFMNTPYTRTPPRLASDGLRVLKGGKIKHVLFIIRENRTYDQVLGDIGKGSSDPSICISAGRSRRTPTHSPTGTSSSTTCIASARCPRTATSGATPPMPPISRRRPGSAATPGERSPTPTSA